MLVPGVIVVLFAVACLAQDPGDRVRATFSQDTRVRTLAGTLVEKSETGLVLKRWQDPGRRTMIPYTRISKLERSIAKGRHWKKGFLYGAVAGVPIGYRLAASYTHTPLGGRETVQLVAGMSITLGLTGMAVGALIPWEKWEVIPVSPVSSVKGLGVRIQL